MNYQASTCFDTECVILRELASLPCQNYVSTIVKINKVFKTLQLPNVIEWLLLHEACMVAVYTICVLMLLLCLSGTY